MAWKGVIPNSGSELLAQWTAGKTLTITRAAAGTGRVSEAAMLAQTALVSEKQTVSILSNKTTAQGQGPGRIRVSFKTVQGSVSWDTCYTPCGMCPAFNYTSITYPC